MRHAVKYASAQQRVGANRWWYETSGDSQQDGLGDSLIPAHTETLVEWFAGGEHRDSMLHLCCTLGSLIPPVAAATAAASDHQAAVLLLGERPAWFR